MIDPSDFDTYLSQRLAEVFGPDIGAFFPTFTPVTARPETRRPMRSAASPIEEYEEVGDVIELTQEEPRSRRRQRRAERQFIPLDIVETDDGYIVEASLPGVPKENIEVHVDQNHVLTIDARPTPSVAHACGMKPETTQGFTSVSTPESPQRQPQSTTGPEQQTQQSSNRKFLLSERHKGRLHRSIRLPKHADAEQVKSCVESGVLCLCFNKIPPTKVSKRIELH